MIHRFCAVSMLLTLLLSAGFADPFVETKPERVGMSAERLERLDTAVQGYIDREEIAGAVTLIARHGKIAHFKAYGYRDLESKAPMGKDSLFRMFSMTKPVTCAALMILVEENEILLSDRGFQIPPRIFEYESVVARKKTGRSSRNRRKTPLLFKTWLCIPQGSVMVFQVNSAPLLIQKNIMIWMCLTLTTNSRMLSIKSIASFPVLHQPGTTWEYGASIDVLARVVEVVAKKPYGGISKRAYFYPAQNG